MLLIINPNDPQRTIDLMECAAKTRQRELAILNGVRECIEDITNVVWIPTSWIRNSYSHRTGLSLDIAPRPRDMNSYAPSFHKDPFLNLRKSLWITLNQQRLKDHLKCILGEYKLLIFVESDHIHIQLMKQIWSFTGQILIKRLLMPKGDSVYLDSIYEFSKLIDRFNENDRQGLTASEIKQSRKE